MTEAQSYEGRVYDRVRRCRGREAADLVCQIAGRVKPSVPDEIRFRWAEERYEDIELARLAGTGYDPLEEFRPLEGSRG